MSASATQGGHKKVPVDRTVHRTGTKALYKTLQRQRIDFISDASFTCPSLLGAAISVSRCV